MQILLPTAKTQFDALGLTTPNFDLVISDENLYNFAHDILDRYDSFDDEKHKVKVRNVSFIDGSILGKSLYEGNELNSDVPSVKFSSIKHVTTDVSNTKITGDVTSDTTTDINFTNVVFEGDVSGIDNRGIYRGVIHFKDEPMKGIYTEYALIKIDTPPTGKRANITGGIMDFRDIKDRLDDLTSDSDYDISNHLSLSGANKIARGYFKDERLKDYIESRVETEAASFADTYFEPVDKEYMKTLQTVEATANKSINELKELFNNHPISTEARQ